ncbi:uncharacterized protein LOC133303647 [Gastrolobium bilobum]|uniref:uncharacterized protein LOC133303647 n=1 Tax=Gastrolobium bilobum TaxID=150636 RepID=UPI002AAF4517|nr:uncharacterized protein LOC133303647 [Gastrolobium bilobum]
MFRWLLKPKFYSKCISYTKCIKTRLETIQKKRRAVQKFMKSDISELLRSGLDYDAYKKAEGLLYEQNMSSCYELIAKFNGCISDHVEDLTKQSDCPDECKEAVPSLMYAAARFADLPELRDLRTLFTEKFENSLEHYTSKEFVEKLRRDPPTREMKIRLLYDIAQEFSIEWDGKDLEQRLYSQPSLREERPKLDKTDNLLTGGEHKDGREYNKSKGKERETLSHFNDDSLRHQNSSDDETSTDMSSHHDRKTSSSSLGSVSEDEPEVKRPFSYWHVPPPYLKQKTNNLKKTTVSEALPKKESNHYLHEPVVQENPIPRSVRRHVRGASLPTESTNAGETSKGHTRAISLERVHPNLPDYDDLAALFAALRGR